MKRKLFLLCTLCLALALCALLSSCNLFGDKNQDMGELDFMPTDDGGGWVVTGIGSYKSSDVVIPETYQGQPVKEIHERAFMFNEHITSVKISDSVEKIGQYAFENCSNLVSVEIGSGVKKMEEDIFNNCESLTTVTLKEGIKALGVRMFAGCQQLKEITIPSSVEIVPNICGGFERVIISEGVKEIGKSAFYGNTSLKAVVLPDSIETIREHAFCDCKSLKSVTFGSGLRVIETAAFYNCESLTFLRLNEGLEEIGEMAFDNCRELCSVVLPSTLTTIKGGFAECRKIVEVYNLSSLGNENCYFSDDTVTHTSLDEESVVFETEDGFVFFDNNGEYYLVSYVGNERELVLPESYNEKNYKIRKCAFYENKNLLSVDIPDNVNYIGDQAFEFCENLMRLVLPKHLNHLGDSCLWNTYRLVEVYNLPSIDLSEATRHFYGDGNVLVEHKTRDEKSAITVTDEGYAFIEYGENCALIGYFGDKEEITLPVGFNDKGYRINDYAFINTHSICKMVIPNTVTEFGKKAFHYAIGLESITLPDTLTSIDKAVFDECYGVIEKENGITYIDRWVVDCDKEITEAVLRDNTYGIAAKAFQDCVSLKSIEFPSTLKVIGKLSFSMCTLLDSIYIPKNVRYIDEFAFARCDNAVIYFESETDDLESATVWNFSARPVVWGVKEYGVTDDFVWGLNSSDEIIIADYIGEGTVITIPQEINGKAVTGIAEYAFYENEVITGVSIPNSVSFVGMNAFDRAACISQDDDGVCYVDKWVVDCYFKATEANIRKGTVGIANLAFDFCENLIKLVIPDSVLYVGRVAVTNCPQLKIYCEAEESTSLLWNPEWNPDALEVFWKYTEE